MPISEQLDQPADGIVIFTYIRAGGLGGVGLHQTLEALKNGQVQEVILGAAVKELRNAGIAEGHLKGASCH